MDTTFEHDDKGRLTRQATGNRTTAYTYDAQGNLATVTGSDNRTVAYSHDAAGRVTAIERPDATTVRFVYDQNGNMRVLTVPTDVDHAFDYNKVDLNTEYETPLSGSYQYLYDKDRRLVKTIFPGGRSIDNHYVDGLLRSVTTPEGQIIYDYACGSKVTSMVMGDESLTFAYDGSLMTSLSQSGELDATIGFQYDDTGELAGLTYAGETIAFTYDLDELTTKVGDFAIARDAQNGLPLAVSDGTATLSRSFNGYGEVETETLAVAGAQVGEVRLERNTIGHITRKTETIDAATQVYDYEYDSMGRLTRVVDGNGTLLEAYTYGKQGERLTQYSLWFDIGNRTFEYDAEDRLLRAGDTQYEYNADGFLTKKITANATVAYTYSSRGETKTVDLGNGTVVEYRHDVLGRPAARLVNGEVTEKYLWLGRTRLLAVYNADDTVKQRFMYADGRMPVAMEQSGELFYFAYDQVGSLRAVTDENGVVQKSVLYDSFGRVISDSNPGLKVPFGFAGGLQDSDTGLVRFGYRDYDPEVGRWTSKDPIGFSIFETDIFVYSQNDPINLIDSNGLFFKTIREGLEAAAEVGTANAKRGADLSEEAISVSRETGLDGALGGAQDAFRHCYWSCRMAQEMGEEVSKKVGDNHEKWNISTDNDRKMDEHNNAVGRELAESGTCPDDCKTKCLDAIKKGENSPLMFSR
ncbi:RHS repeat domain-containing protein [Megalodesulfovibrio paquesii]